MKDDDWARRARCRGMKPNDFYVDIGEREPTMGTLEMRRVCDPCVVRAECLAEGLAEQEYLHGACRGGLLPREQRRIVKAVREGEGR